jgi:GT2 family glycosyltransferase
MELPTISIITPCLNAADSIDEALESVRSQDYPPVEHVVVDGGWSTPRASGSSRSRTAGECTRPTRAWR